jgi:hypothetical protein
MRDGTPFGRYRLLELTSHGAVGDMWRAFDTVTHREVALRIPSTQDTVGAAAKRDASYPAYGPQSGVVVEYVVDYPLARSGDRGEEQSTPNPSVPRRSRKGRWIALSSAAIAVIVATVAATILVPRYLERSASPPASTEAPATRLANTGPLTGAFRVSMGPRLTGSGTPGMADGSEAYSQTWQLRWVLHAKVRRTTRHSPTQAIRGGEQPQLTRLSPGPIGVLRSLASCGVGVGHLDVRRHIPRPLRGER